MPQIKRVLFFCAGNTCRSPFAEYFSKWLKDTKYQDDLKDVEFDSAGIYSYYQTPQEGTLRYLSSKGIEVDNFKAKKLDEDLIRSQDLILGFEKKRHIDKIKRKFKTIDNLDEKVFLLLDYAGEKQDLDIEDPFYLPEEEYNEILKRIETGVIKTIEKVIQINKRVVSKNE